MSLENTSAVSILFSKKAARIVLMLYSLLGAIGAILYFIYPIIARGVLPLASTLVTVYMLMWFGYDWGKEHNLKEEHART